jgi:hypothetical protein
VNIAAFAGNRLERAKDRLDPFFGGHLAERGEEHGVLGNVESRARACAGRRYV